jgi:hypothetical protein
VKLPVCESVNQLLVVQLCSDTAADALTLLCAVTVNVCELGAEDPATALNVNEVLLKVRVAAVAVTLNVTDTVCVTEFAVKEMVPVHVLPAAIPD